MITYRKSDLPKVLLLVVLIGATFWGSYHFLLSPSARPTAPRPAQAAKGAPAALPAPQLVARLGHDPVEMIARARSAPDPFRPGVIEAAVLPAAEPTAPPVTTVKAKPGAAVSSTPEAPALRLVGVVSGDRPIAVLVGDGRRFYVGVGEALPDGWKVLKLGRRQVQIGKDAYRCTLELAGETPEKRPAAPPLVR